MIPKHLVFFLEILIFRQLQLVVFEQLCVDVSLNGGIVLFVEKIINIVLVKFKVKFYYLTT